LPLRLSLQGAFYILSYPLVEFLNQGSSKLLTFNSEVCHDIMSRSGSLACLLACARTEKAKTS